MNQHHPYVSEVHEGKPAFEWCVLGVVIVALVVAFLGYRNYAGQDSAVS